MINSINLKNFQSHKDTSIPLNKGVNVLLGRSGSGKSSIIRALLFAAKNKPKSDSIKRYNTKETEVNLEIDNHTITRIKTNSKNIYKLNDEEFTTFGTEVPEPISTIVNMNETNINNQHDAHFLLSQSSGQVSTFFNKLANLELIDSTRSGISSKLTLHKKAKEKALEDRKRLKEELEQFKDLSKLQEKLEYLEDFEDNLNNIKSKIEILKNILSQILKLDSEVAEISEEIKIEPKIDEILSLFSKKKEKHLHLAGLSAKFTQIVKIHSEIASNEKTINLEHYVSKIFLRLENKRERVKILENMKNMYKKIESTQVRLELLKNEIETVEKYFHEQMGETCVLCGNKIK